MSALQHPGMYDEVSAVHSLNSRGFAECQTSSTQADSVSKYPIGAAAQGLSPSHMDEIIVTRSHDTAENRFVKTFLESCEALLAKTQRIVEQ